jgi:hypothetical protein
VRSNERCRISTVTVAQPHRTLGRLLNSCGDFAAAVEFVGRARACGRADIEYDALVLGALVSYSRPFKEADDPILGRPLDQLPAFLDAAVDLGVDLELHLELLELGTRAIGSSKPVTAAVRRSASRGNQRTHRFSFPNPLGHVLAQQLAPGPFEHISHLMRLACVFTLRQIARPDA